MKPKKIVIKLTPEQIAQLQEQHHDMLRTLAPNTGMHLGQVVILDDTHGAIVCSTVDGEQAVRIQAITRGRGGSWTAADKKALKKLLERMP